MGACVASASVGAVAPSLNHKAGVNLQRNFVGNFAGSFVDEVPGEAPDKDATQTHRMLQRNDLMMRRKALMTAE